MCSKLIEIANPDLITFKLCNCHLQKLDMGQAGVAVSDSFWEISESFSTPRTRFDVAQ
jgi:hypothetical protein